MIYVIDATWFACYVKRITCTNNFKVHFDDYFSSAIRSKNLHLSSSQKDNDFFLI